MHDLFNSGTDLCGIGANTKDKSGDIMSWATSLSGLSGSESLYRPILDFRETLNSNTKHNCSQFKALLPHVPPWWEIDYRRGASFGLSQWGLRKLATLIGYSDKCTLLSFR